MLSFHLEFLEVCRICVFDHIEHKPLIFRIFPVRIDITTEDWEVITLKCSQADISQYEFLVDHFSLGFVLLRLRADL